MPKAANAPDVNETLDVELRLSAKIAFNTKVIFNDVTNKRRLFLGEISHLDVLGYARPRKYLLAGGRTYAEYVLESDDNMLVTRQIHTRYTRHTSAPHTGCAKHDRV